MTTNQILPALHPEPANGKDITAVVAAMDRDVQSGISEIMGSLEQYFSEHAQATAAAR